MATVTKGRTFVSGEIITPAKLNDVVDLATVTEIVNADIKSDAAIAFSKLAALDDANILVGNGSNVATKVAVTGDVTISNSGVTAIGNAKVVPAMLSQKFTLETAENSTSGASVEFTSIPPWAKRITVIFVGVSTNGTSGWLLQLGDSGGFETSGYVGVSGVCTASLGSSANSSTAGLLLTSTGPDAAATYSGASTLSLLDGTVWVHSGTLGSATGSRAFFNSGLKELSATLDRIRVTTVNGTDAFDAGRINISYEG
jgi:hypothetical protein